MEVFILIALILLNGVFAMSEIALVTAKRGRLARLAAEADMSSQAWFVFKKNFDRHIAL